MLGTMNSVAFHASLYANGQPVLAEVLRVRDAYLEPFKGPWPRAPTSSVRVRLARRTGCVGKAMAYRAALAGEPVSRRTPASGFPVQGGWLLALLED